MSACSLHAIGGLRDAEVGETSATVAADEQVVRAHVAMNDAEVPPLVVVEDVRGL